MNIPAVVIFRDRVSYAKQCVAALNQAGLDVHIVDHASTWPVAVDWLDTCGLPVHRLPNGHPRDLWTWDGLHRIVGARRYVVTDPDVIPDPDCPLNWVEHFDQLLDERPGWLKVGLGLRIDNLPAHYEHAERVRQWESQWWSNAIADDVYNASVDTTLALYRSLADCSTFALAPALRTGAPYLARHLTWYQDSANPTAEQEYYVRNVTRLVSHWVDPEAYQ